LNNNGSLGKRRMREKRKEGWKGFGLLDGGCGTKGNY
jgi:hypothetical protein